MNLCADAELQPEIRDESVTIYYRGHALLRELRVLKGSLLAEIHPKFVPFPGAELNTSVRLTGTDGLAFVKPPVPLPLGVADPDVLEAYKALMDQVLGSLSEGQVVQDICCRPESQILDQEIAFQESGESRDKIDICHFDDGLGKIVFVEVKRVDDPRLLGNNGFPPEVLGQLQAYGDRLRTQRDAILAVYRQVVVWKRELGLGSRLRKVPSDGPCELLDKPVLVIGNCTRGDVRSILDAVGKWAPLMARLRDVAAGLILCGHGGCRLNLTNGRQARVF
jgi:hypothetical protein